MSATYFQARSHRTDAKRGKRKRLAAGVFERSGKFLVSYIGPDGCEHLKTLGWVKCDAHLDGLTLRDAKAEREKLRVKTRAGEVVTPSKATVAELGRGEYFPILESLVATGGRSERTIERYRSDWKNYLEPRFGRLPIQDLRAEHISKMLAELRTSNCPRTGRPLSPSAISNVLKPLSGILELAVTRGLIAESPLRRLSKMERPKPRSLSEARVLSREEIETLIELAPPTYRPLIATFAYTGLRLQEALGLIWEEIDFDQKELRLRAQLSRATREKPPRRLLLKTSAARRDVILLPALETILREHRQHAFADGLYRADGYVFCTANGKPFYCRNVSERGVTKAADRAGLNVEGRPRLTCHDFRHSFASHLIRAGADVYSVSRQLGHTRPSLTLDVYAGEFEKTKNSAALREKLAAVFGGGA